MKMKWIKIVQLSNVIEKLIAKVLMHKKNNHKKILNGFPLHNHIQV